MIAVLFEVVPAEGCRQAYLDLAAALRPLLDGIDGFVSIERFESLQQPGKILSLSCWRDEAAVQRWRQLDAHRAAQARGRGALFADYRLRIATVVRDYGLRDRAQAPADSRSYHASGEADRASAAGAAGAVADAGAVRAAGAAAATGAFSAGSSARRAAAPRRAADSSTGRARRR